MTILPRPWDSTFFGVRIFEAHLRNDELTQAFEDAARAGAECLYLFVDSGDVVNIETAVRNGAHLVDLRVELAGRVQLETGRAAPPTRRATHADRSGLLLQASELAKESRFARDARIADQRVREMYEIWLDCCLDEGVVAVPEAGEAGFVGARPEGDEARIELVYVNAASRGQGLGRALIREAVASVATSDTSVVSVVTQTGNVSAQRLYQSLGLRSRSTIAVLHLWLDERDG
jgi:ribosomal protein S18 acetylase RimI-like enzyme